MASENIVNRANASEFYLLSVSEGVCCLLCDNPDAHRKRWNVRTSAQSLLLVALLSVWPPALALSQAVDSVSGAVCEPPLPTDLSALRPRAEAGDPVAEYQFAGSILISKQPSDPALAMQWFQRSAEQGYAPAEYRLGAMFRVGRWRNPERLVYWWTRAAEHGDVGAQQWLGSFYEQGSNGVQRDYQLAIHWLSRAAQQGQTDAQNLLGEMYENGEGVPQSLPLAARWYRKAANHVPDFGGAGQGRQNLANLYMRGLGGRHDLIEAYMWYALTGRPNADSIKSSNNPAAEHMTPREIAEAQRRAKEWINSHPAAAVVCQHVVVTAQ